ncbi:MAG TPA: hypothetical protein VKY35_07330 [Aliidiomarina sp.]|nr:hypothetical protein [Aliidiomarina sp.]
MINCDPDTGACQLPEQAITSNVATPIARPGWAVHYISDPMCSWCWGISPIIRKVADYCQAQGIEFTLTMGGLRPGGGELWNDALKNFLRQEWQQINQTTGQPFGYALLEQVAFNYDTEPACRAIAVVKLLQAKLGFPIVTLLNFLAAMQHKFYVESQDPKEVGFYASICNELELSFDEFSALFHSTEGQQAVQQDFMQSRQWGVRAFPTLLLEHNGKIKPLSVGYSSAEQILATLQHELAL